MAKRCGCVAGLFAAIVGVSLGLAQEGPATAMPASDLPAGVTTAAEARAVYAARLAAALPALTSATAEERSPAEQPFQASGWLATRPGAEPERRGLGEALAAALATALPTPTRLFLVTQLAIVGRDEAATALAALLTDPDRQIRDAALRALAANPSAPAGVALRSHLATTSDPGAQAAVLQALLYRRDPEDTPAFRQAAQSAQEALYRVGCEGLARLGTASDAALLRAAMANAPEATRPAAADAYLQLADRLAAAGDRQTALGLYRELLTAPGAARHAAIIGVGRAGGPGELPTLIGLLADADADARGAARMALALLPAAEAVQALTVALETAPPQLRVALLQALAESRVPAVRPALTAALANGDEELRLIAINGLGALGDPAAAPALAQVVAGTQGAPLEAARNALALLAGDAVPAALMAAFPTATPSGRQALLVTLATRRGPATLSFLQQSAASDPEARVRAEALRALARLTTAADIPALLQLLLAAATEDERDEATLAIAAAARRAPDPASGVAPVLAALAEARPEARARLLRAMGRLGGDQALGAVRQGLADPDPAIRAAAVRGLADWPDGGALDELLNLLTNAPETVLRVLALRGYVRIVRESGTLAPAEQLARLTAAMAVAPRPEDRRLILAGLGDVADPGALPAALACLDAPETAGEASAALTALVERLRWRHPDACCAALDQIAAKAPTDADRAKATALRADLQRYADHLSVWLLAGPYLQDGAKRQDLHAIAFPPEQDPPPAAVTWKAVRTGDTPESCWFVPLDVLLKGDQRAAYLRTWIRVPAACRARLEIGSDDGCKAWLNGHLIVDQDVDRALTPAQDTPEVTLNPGWNGLLLKVTQGGGYWSATARVRAPAGSRLADVVVMDSPTAMDLAVADLAKVPADPAAWQAGLDLARAEAGTVAQRRTLLTGLAASGAAEIATEAQERLRRLDLGEDYLIHWELAGPYEQAGVAGPGLLDVVFAPEPATGQTPAWHAASVSPGADSVPMVDLGQLLGGTHRVAYLRARVVAATAQPVQLELGSDDGVKVWLNGSLVHSNNASRPVRPGDDKAAAELRAGENLVLLKVTQGDGGWGACLRLRTPAGGHLADVREAAPAAP